MSNNDILILKVNKRRYWFYPIFIFLWLYIVLLFFSFGREKGLFERSVFFILAIGLGLIGVLFLFNNIMKYFRYKIKITKNHILISDIFLKNRKIFDYSYREIHLNNIVKYNYINDILSFELRNGNQYEIDETIYPLGDFLKMIDEIKNRVGCNS